MAKKAASRNRPDRIQGLDDKLTTVIEQTAPKVEKPGKKNLKKVGAISDGVELGKKLYEAVKATCKFCTTIKNEMEGVALEIVTQSSSAIHDKVDGKYLVAPDPFIPENGFTNIVTQKRDHTLVGNANGVIYKAKFFNEADNCYVIVSWRNPIRGKAHFYVHVTKDKGCVRKGFLNDLRQTCHTSLLFSPKSGLEKNKDGSLKTPPADGILIEASATYIREHLQVTIQPRSLR